MTARTREQILAALKDPHPARREEAVLEIGILMDPTLQAALLPILADPVPRLRWRALQSLGSPGLPRGMLDRVAVLLHDEAAQVRAEAARLIGEAREAGFLDSLGPLLAEDDPLVRYRAIEAVGEIGEPREEVMARLLEFLQEDDFRVRMHAAIALGQCRYTRALHPLLQALRDPNPNVRGYAAWALGALGEEAAIEPLIEVLSDGGESVRLRVFQAIASFGERAAPHLQRTLRCGPPGLRPLVESLLEQIRSPETEARRSR